MLFITLLVKRSHWVLFKIIFKRIEFPLHAAVCLLLPRPCPAHDMSQVGSSPGRVVLTYSLEVNYWVMCLHPITFWKGATSMGSPEVAGKVPH